MALHDGVKLGRQPKRTDSRTLKLARYVDLDVLPAPPAELARAQHSLAEFQMYGNDQFSDCTIAGIGNLTQFWAALTREDETTSIKPVSEAGVLEAYSAWTGYSPDKPNSDNGAVELYVLRDWRNKGIEGHTIGAFAAVRLADKGLIQTACWLFDGLYLGVELPKTAQDQDVWEFVPSAAGDSVPGSWGGHCVVMVDYNATGPVYATWGALKQATWEWHNVYCDEQYALITADYLADNGKTVEGFDTAQLQADLARLA